MRVWRMERVCARLGGLAWERCRCRRLRMCRRRIRACRRATSTLTSLVHLRKEKDEKLMLPPVLFGFALQESPGPSHSSRPARLAKGSQVRRPIDQLLEEGRRVTTRSGRGKALHPRSTRISWNACAKHPAPITSFNSLLPTLWQTTTPPSYTVILQHLPSSPLQDPSRSRPRARRSSSSSSPPLLSTILTYAAPRLPRLPPSSFHRSTIGS
jgi:hypothetical protein